MFSISNLNSFLAIYNSLLSNNSNPILLNIGNLFSKVISGTNVIVDSNPTGTNVINGTADDDIIFHMSGNDTINGDAGDDEIYLNITPNQNAYGATVYAGEGDDIVEDLGNGDDIIYGDAGNDRINGGFGNDELYGGEGNDILIAGTNTALGNGARIRPDNDILDGGEGIDLMIGNFGDDLFIGRGDGDTIRGGEGAERRGDTVDYSDYNDSISVNLAQFAGGASSPDRIFDVENVIGTDLNDRISGSRDDNILVGNAGDDRLHGNRGNDYLRGGDGDDHLYGGRENDTLEGGEGDDVFYFTRDNRGSDVILDFISNEDTINLSHFTLRNIDDFSDLTIGQNAAGDATIDAQGIDITLKGVDYTTLTSDDFIF